MTRAAVGIQSWASTLERAIKQTVVYTLSIGTMRMAQQMLNDAIRFTIDLNTEMTKIQVLQAEGAQTPGQIRQLALEYNQLAKELGATTIEIAQGSVEWLRQGKTVSETTELLNKVFLSSSFVALRDVNIDALSSPNVSSLILLILST
jgi:K+-sensing histidine kinase KdpD